MPVPVSWSWKPLTVLTLLLLGVEARAAGDEPPPTGSGQGTHLHGTGELEHINIPLSSAEGRLLSPPSGTISNRRSSKACKNITLKEGALQGQKGLQDLLPCEDEDLKGTVFSAPFAGTVVRFTIQEIRPHQSILASKAKTGQPVLRIPGRNDSRPLPEYRVTWRYRDQASTEEQALCKTGNGFALAVPHAWSTSGELLFNPGYFTFACVPAEQVSPVATGPRLFTGGGVIAKCIDWGYAPWSKPTGDKLADDKRDVAAREAHQVCVRMATADYCGEGRVNTLDGTPIAFADAAAAQTAGKGLKKIPSFGNANTDAEYGVREYHLEAAWGIDSCSKNVQVVCLSRARWNTLSLDGACINQEALSRLRQPAGGPMRHCEDWSPEELKSKARLVSYSSLIDKVLVTFSNGQHFLTTADVERYAANSKTFEDWYRPGKSFPAAETFKQVRVEGTILGRELPPSLRKGLVPLYRCPNAQGAQGFFLATDILCMEPKRVMTEQERQERVARLPVEGFIWAPDTQKPRVKPLYVWKRARARGEITYVTSTRAPEPADEYEQVGEALGYLPVMDQLAELTGK
jgi:hypothetical protein